MKLIKVNVIFEHGITLLTSSEKLREIGAGPKFAFDLWRGLFHFSLLRLISLSFYFPRNMKMDDKIELQTGAKENC